MTKYGPNVNPSASQHLNIAVYVTAGDSRPTLVIPARWDAELYTIYVLQLPRAGNTVLIAQSRGFILATNYDMVQYFHRYLKFIYQFIYYLIFKPLFFCK